jgi:uncharacterized membrane protein YsdA (DUF1294 family)
MTTPDILLAGAITYAVMSVVTALIYGWDKLCAIRGWSRVPEVQLHLLALLCGWPGAWVAQRVFRHKSYKKSFLVVFFLTVALNCLALGAAVYALAE